MDVTDRDYLFLQAFNNFAPDELSGILNRNQAASLTVCPQCRVDDFVHVEGCILRRETTGLAAINELVEWPQPDNR